MPVVHHNFPLNAHTVACLGKVVWQLEQCHPFIALYAYLFVAWAMLSNNNILSAVRSVNIVRCLLSVHEVNKVVCILHCPAVAVWF